MECYQSKEGYSAKNVLERLFTFLDRFVANGSGESGLEQ